MRKMSYAGRHYWIGYHRTQGLLIYDPEAQSGADSDTVRQSILGNSF